MRKTICMSGLCTIIASQAFASDFSDLLTLPTLDSSTPATWTGCYMGAFGAYDFTQVSNARSENILMRSNTTTTTAGTPVPVTINPVQTALNPALGALSPVSTVTTTTSRTTNTTVRTQTLTTAQSSSSYGRSFGGGDGGARFGCNYQKGSFVLGAQLEGGYLGAGATSIDPVRPSTFSTLSGGAYGAISAKLGYALNPRTLLYVRGGVGYADLRYTTGDPTLNYASSIRGTQAMPLVGAGLEYKLTPRVSLTGEYTYMHASCRSGSYVVPNILSQSTSGATTTANTTSDSGTYSECVDKHLVSIGSNYYFGAPPDPVIARY